MKSSEPCFKQEATMEHRTSYTHSNYDEETPIKPKLTRQLAVKKQVSKPKLTKKNATSTPQLITYKCGCTNHPVKTNIFNPISINLSLGIVKKRTNVNVSVKQNEKNQQRQSIILTKEAKQHLNKKKSKSSLNNLLKRINTLEDRYKQLMNESINNIEQTIKYVPRQVVRSIDKIIRVDRPIQRKILKIKKIPKQLLSYREKIIQIPIYKQQLVFVDPPNTPQFQQVKTNYSYNEVIKQIPKDNQQNLKLKRNLFNFRQKKNLLNIQVTRSKQHINCLNQDILAKRAKSHQAITINQYQPFVVLLGASKINSSIATTVINKSQTFSVNRSRSLPIHNRSVISIKSKLFINGKQQTGNEQIDKTNMVKSIVFQSPRASQQLIIFKSSPQLHKQIKSSGQICEGLKQFYQQIGIQH